MKWIALILGLLGLVLIQTSAAPAFAMLGVAPNLLLVVLCCWAVVRAPGEAMILVPLAGLLIGLLSFQGTAESVAAFAPIVVLAALRERLAVRREYLWALALVIAATPLHFMALAAAIEVEGSRIDWLAAMADVMLPSVLVNTVVALVIYWLVRLPTPRPSLRVA